MERLISFPFPVNGTKPEKGEMQTEKKYGSAFSIDSVSLPYPCKKS
ncbi:MAG: hypothetical protein JW863_13435 [Chitinispirillaceae bacterium]|nr:hypothetical protein [Chitinispirillaceae bacterium]